MNPPGATPCRTTGAIARTAAAFAADWVAAAHPEADVGTGRTLLALGSSRAVTWPRRRARDLAIALASDANGDPATLADAFGVSAHTIRAAAARGRAGADYRIAAAQFARS